MLYLSSLKSYTRKLELCCCPTTTANNNLLLLALLEIGLVASSESILFSVTVKLPGIKVYQDTGV